MSPPRLATASRPTRLAAALHWFVAIGVVGMLAFGFYISLLPRGDAKSALIQTHKSFGMIVFALAALRVGWRLRVGWPERTDGPDWERTAARLAHRALLAGTLLMPLTGLIRSLAYARPVSVFGWTVVPQLVADKHEGVYAVASTGHEVVAWLLVALLVLHVAATAKHHLIDHDDALTRMSPFAARETTP